MLHRCPPRARHPHTLLFDPAVQLAAAAVLLKEGVEGGEQFGHGADGMPRGWAEQEGLGRFVGST